MSNLNKKINVLSLFDGISCGQIALNRASIQYGQYFASEIDPYAIKVTQQNYPQTIQLGDIKKWEDWKLPKIDLVLAGSPCQGFSFAGKQLNFDDPRSKLFFEFVDILDFLKPEYFLLENVKMKREIQDTISDILNVEPILINSSKVSAQNRPRLYWTNITGVTQPEDKNILIKDIIEKDIKDPDFVHEKYVSNGFKYGNCWQYDISGKGNNSQSSRAYFMNGKMGSLTCSSSNFKILTHDGKARKTTRLEHERLQTLPDHYTESIDLNKAKKAIGNGWTVDIISHILKNIKCYE